MEVKKMFNFCFWDIPAALILIGVVIGYLARRSKLKE